MMKHLCLILAIVFGPQVLIGYWGFPDQEAERTARLFVGIISTFWVIPTIDAFFHSTGKSDKENQDGKEAQ